MSEQPIMSSYAPYQVPYHNQLQFNLGVPLMTQNLMANYQHPAPIIVERVGGQGQHAVPSKIQTEKLQGSGQHTNRSGANYSMLSEDKMEVMSQLARRDLKNRALQAQMTSAASSPAQKQPRNPGGKTRSRLQPQQNRSRPPLTAKEAEKNRRFGAVQTPPPRRPTSYTRAANESALSQQNVTAESRQESDIFFPVKPSLPGDSNTSDEIAKLQLEMEGYLHLVERIVERAIDERSTEFLRPAMRGKQRDGYLIEEEGYDRARARVGEQNTRSVRNLYNLRQKVKQLQRDSGQADLSKPAKKSQVTAQLVVIYRAAAKCLSTFVNQLPYQDLTNGLPGHFHEVSLLLKQLSGLASLMHVSKHVGSDQGELLALLETIEAVNAKWCAQLRSNRPLIPAQRKEKKSLGSKGWVSDTKVDKNIFLTKDKPGSVPVPTQQSSKRMGQQAAHKKQQQLRQHTVGRQNRAPRGKENRKDFNYTGRREELRSGIAALLHHQGGQPDLGEVADNGRTVPPPVAWDVDFGHKHQTRHQDSRKGYLLPSDLLERRERAQRAVQASNLRDWNFADATVSSRLKTSLRPSSAPPSPDKRVNFDLESEQAAPWIPTGSNTSRTSHTPRSRSLSPAGRSPFYLRDLDSKDVSNVFPERQNLRNTKARGVTSEIPRFGYQSLPTDKKLRSADVSNSFIDEVEHRLLARMMGQQSEDHYNRRAPLVEYQSSSGLNETGDTTEDFFSEAGDTTLDMTDPKDLITREAVSLMDAPTLENVKLRLRQMQQEQKEIRQRWSSLKFYDSNTKSKIFSASEILSERPRDPPALEFGSGVQSEQRHHTNWPVSKEVVEVPLIFTKPALSSSRAVQYLHTVYPGGSALAGHSGCGDRGGRESPLTVVSLQQPSKRLLSLKQTTAERIAADRSRFESYLKRRSHHPSGKFDPWALVDEISDEILTDCLQDVAQEVEGINEEIANNMYTSEFLVDQTRSPGPDAATRSPIEASTNQRGSPQLSPHGRSGDGDRAGGFHERPRLMPHTHTVAPGIRPAAGAQGDMGDLRLALDGESHNFSQRDARPMTTPRSPRGVLRVTPRSPGSYMRGGLASPPGVANQSPPDRGDSPGTGAHLWRSSVVSPTGSVGQGGGSRSSMSPTPRSPHVSPGARAGMGRVTPRGGPGSRSPLRDGRSPSGEGRQSPHVSASEPLLDDVSHLLPNKRSEEDEEESPDSEDTRVERGQESARRGASREDDDEDDEDEDYSEEDFEDVTDVEL